MPKFVGRTIEGSTEIPWGGTMGKVKLSYSQAILLPAEDIYCYYNTSDRGSRGTLAKRWYEWYAKPEDILLCTHSTPRMRAKAREEAGSPES
ncbi:MAG: hypothetical protein MN733_25880 [Nitrososphaera sp.]|nr:hypothetical protein [Nitrososphaera sp.]